MNEGEHGTLAGQEHLARYWDALTQGAGQESVDLDPALVAAVHRFHALNAQHQAPGPDAIFVSHLQEDLMATARPAGFARGPFVPTRKPEAAPNGWVMGGSRPWSAHRLPPAGRRGIMAQLATAALLVLTVGTGLFASRAWSPRGDDAGVPLPAINDELVPAGEFEFLWQSDGGGEPLDATGGLGIDPEGNLWLANATANSPGEFRIFAPDGAALETWSGSGGDEGQFDFSAVGWQGIYGDIAFDTDGTFYVADTGNHRVQKFGPDRDFLMSWGGNGDGEGQFMAPASIAVSTDGRVYVSDQTRGDIQIFDTEGQLLGATGRLGMVGGVAVDEDRDIWVTVMEEDQIHQLSAAGEPIAVWDNGGADPGQIRFPTDVAIDALGRVYVVEWDNNRLEVFSQDGTFLAGIGSFGSGPGQFNVPWGVAVAADGPVYVSDRNSIQAFRVLLPTGYALMS